VPEYVGAWQSPEEHIRDEWLLPGKSCEVGDYNASYISETENPGLYKTVMDSTDKVWFYGIVRYLDSVSENERETRFCFKCGASRRGDHFLYADGPEAYRLET